MHGARPVRISAHNLPHSVIQGSLHLGPFLLHMWLPIRDMEDTGEDGGEVSFHPTCCLCLPSQGWLAWRNDPPS